MSARCQELSKDIIKRKAFMNPLTSDFNPVNALPNHRTRYEMQCNLMV